MLLEVKNQASLKNLMQESGNKLVILYFWASWSNIGKSVLPIINKIGREIGDTVIIGVIDAEEHKDIASNYNIQSIPTLVAFRKGIQLESFSGIGLTKEERIMQFIKMN